jgi:hypothetical protein
MGDKLLGLKLRRIVARLLRPGGHTPENAAIMTIDYEVAEHPTIKASLIETQFTVAKSNRG